MSANPMFGDDQTTALVPMALYSNMVWYTYFPSAVQWEVARQMHADWHRIRNQEITITELQSDLSASRDECERYRSALAGIVADHEFCAKLDGFSNRSAAYAETARTALEAK